MTAKDIGGKAAEHSRQFFQCCQQAGRIMTECDALEAGAADLTEE